jgi:signal transduction histidine kinase
MNEARSERAPNVLIVDDATANLQVLSSMLKERGYEARPVPSGRLALQAAASDPPDLILLDITMPDLSGYEVCERLKADARLADIPVIFISASTEALDKIKAFGVGGVDYVTKPFRFEEVHARVSTHLALRKLRLSLAARNQELEKSLDQLRRLEALRDSLVHMIVHDLKSPLTVLSFVLDAVMRNGEGGIPADALADLEQAHGAATKMIRMVNAVLDVSKLEAGEMTLNRSKWDLAALMREAMAALLPLARDRNLVFRQRESSMAVYADRDLIARVVDNLLTNAIRYTPDQGEISVEIEALEDAVRVSVADSGPGIAEEHQTHIFEKFAQVEARNEGRALRSTGLGLTFCRLAVEAHGGRIGVVSEPGKGSTFWFTLPGSA